MHVYQVKTLPRKRGRSPRLQGAKLIIPLLEKKRSLRGNTFQTTDFPVSPLLPTLRDLG